MAETPPNAWAQVEQLKAAMLAAGIPVETVGADVQRPPPGDGEQAPPLAEVRLTGKNRTLDAFARDMGAVMSAAGVYCRDRLPVVLGPDNSLEVLTPAAFRSFAHRHAFIYRMERAGEEWIKARWDIPKDVSADTLASAEFLSHLRPIRRVATRPMPIQRPTGEIELLQPGYDERSGILTVPAGVTVGEWTAEEARTWLVQFFAGFPFADRTPAGLSRGLAAQVAAMLTPFCLGLLDVRALLPMFISTANTQGAGKSLLIKIALYATHGEADALAFGRGRDGEDELRKQLDTAALENKPFIFFDNVKSKVSSQLLDMWMTQSRWAGRRMGKQAGFAVDKQSVVFVSANHVRTDRDSNRRAVFIDLWEEEDDIQARTHDHIIDDVYLSRPEVQSDILSALWALVRDWAEAGRPKPPRVLRSFEKWSAVVPAIVAHAGLGDPLQPTEIALDTDSRDMRELVARLAEERLSPEQSSVEVEFDDLIDLCRAHDLFVDKITGKERSTTGEFELDRVGRSVMGKLFNERAGAKFRTPGGAVRFGRRGSKNWRRFWLERIA